MFRKWFALLLTLLLLLGNMTTLAWAEAQNEKLPKVGPPALDTVAEAAVLMDYTSGKVIFQKNKDQKLPMASVTKLMTMLLACEANAQGKINLPEKIVVSDHAASMGGSQIYLEPGEEMTFEEMMISIATGSANDASMAVAERLAGSEEAFVQMMNQKASELGLKNTHFSNPTGLPIENHYTSASDMALILREDLKYPLFRRVSGMYEHDLRGGEFKLWNTNKLLKWYKGCDAGKTGWTNQAKYCLAASAERDNLRLISVVLGCPQPRTHFQETIKLFNYGFATYQSVILAKANKEIKSLAVDKGTVESVKVVTEGQVSAVIPRGDNENIKGEISLPKTVKAPVKKGQVVGTYWVKKDGQTLSKVNLVAAEDVAEASPFNLMGKVLEKMFSLKK